MKNVLVLGFFDGIHLGHREVISSAVDYARDIEGTAILITFLDSPLKYFNNSAEYIFSREDSVNKIKELGVDEVVEQDFSKIVSMPAENYLKNLYTKYSPIAIFTGFNHTFGFKKSGTPEFLNLHQEKYNYEYHCIPPRFENGEIVSSTLIKSFLKTGEIRKANLLLGSQFHINGKVEKGAQLGRQIGFPTANITYPEGIVKVPYGVYCVEVSVEGHKYSGVLNWGIKPTVGNIQKPITEVHILNFNQDIYGKEVQISFIEKLRDEKKFGSLSELKLQIQEDIKKCLES